MFPGSGRIFPVHRQKTLNNVTLMIQLNCWVSHLITRGFRLENICGILPQQHPKGLACLLNARFAQMIIFFQIAFIFSYVTAWRPKGKYFY